MADDWGSTEGGGKKKRNPLLWGCGLGCLGLLVIAGVIGFMGVGWIKDAVNPEASLERLAEALPVEEVPEGWSLLFGNKVPFVDLEIFVMTGSGAESDGSMMTASFFVVQGIETANSHWDETAPSGGVERTIDIQGRSLEGSYNAEAGPGATFMLKLSEENELPVIMVQFQRTHSKKEITDEELRVFFDSFTIGPDGAYSLVQEEPEPIEEISDEEDSDR
jgi:hypothetical protein